MPLYKTLFYALLLVFVSESSQAQSLVSTANIKSNTRFESNARKLELVESKISSEALSTNRLPKTIVSDRAKTKDFEIKTPKTLSPNGDGINDVWGIEELEKYPENELTIFDLDGKTVYATTNYRNTWAGTLDGAPLPENTYNYVFKLKKQGLTRTVKGFFNIVK